LSPGRRTNRENFMRIPQFLIGVASSGYRSVNFRFAPASLRSASPSDRPSDLRRRSNLQLCLPTQPPTLIGCQILWPAFQSIFSLRLQPIFRPSFPVDLRLTSPIYLPAPPSNRPATVATCRSSGLPSDQPRACAFGQSSGSAFPFTSGFRLRPTFRLCPVT